MALMSLLAACWIDNAQIIGSDFYQVEIPENMSLIDRSSNIASGYYFATYGKGSLPENHDWSIRIDSNIESDCTTSNLGISSPQVEQKTEDEYLMWGEVDLFKHIGLGDIVEYDLLEECRSLSTPDKGGAYVLCAKEGDKQVIICISQATDNPDLAKQIFSTFRWGRES